MKLNLFKWSLLCLFFTSCYSVAHLPTNDSTERFEKTEYSEIKVYSVSDIDKEYIIIGQVVANADAGTDGNVPVNYLKKEAAKLGADAIINLRLEVDYGYWMNAIKATGTAVKFK